MISNFSGERLATTTIIITFLQDSYRDAATFSCAIWPLSFGKNATIKKIWRKKCVPCRSRMRRDHLKLSSGKFRNYSPVGYESRSRRAAFVIATPWLKMGRGQAFNIRAFLDLRLVHLLLPSGLALPAGRSVNDLV